MTDLHRFFQLLVRNLAASDPDRLRGPLPLADIRNSIVPYRANRRALQLESSEDYELILMRLCAGEADLATTEPADIGWLFAAELQTANPDLGLLYLHENAVVRLQPQPLAEALNPYPSNAFAPPPHVETSVAQQPVSLELTSLDPPVDDFLAGAATTAHCLHCGGRLPGHRIVNFCPHCGGVQGQARCATCEAPVEAGWRHCVTCGAPLSRA